MICWYVFVDLMFMSMLKEVYVLLYCKVCIWKGGGKRQHFHRHLKVQWVFLITVERLPEGFLSLLEVTQRLLK